MFDQLVSFIMGLIIFGMVAYFGVAIMSKVWEVDQPTPIQTIAATTVPTVAPPADVGSAASDAIGWVSIIVVALAAVMTLTLLFGVFGAGDYTPAKPEMPIVKAPEPVRAQEPTLDEIVSRSPEIRALDADLTGLDYEIEKNSEELKQIRSGRGMLARFVLRLKNRA